MSKGSEMSLLNKKGMKSNATKQYIGIVIVLIVLLAIGSILSFDTFMTWSNISNVLRQASIVGIIAVGMTFVILTGGIDLSVGSNMILSSVFAATFFNAYGVGAMFFMALLVGTVFGLANGFFITKFNLAPFILTLGMLNVGRGLALIYTDARIVVGYNDFTSQLGAGYIANFLPIPVAIFIGVIVVGLILEKKTLFGRYVYAIGGNEEAAKLSAINVKKIKTIAYTFCGLLCGLASIVSFARIGSASAEIGEGAEMDAIAAVVIGGTSLAGGVGSVGGTVVGMIIIQLMSNLLNMLNVSPFAQQAVKGAIIIGAIIIYQQQAKFGRKKTKSI